MSEVEEVDVVETAPEETVGAAEESKYLVLIGAKRWISAFVNQGRLVQKNETVKVGPTMAAILLSRTFTDINNQTRNVFREATPQEVEKYENRLVNLDPATADPALLAEAARKEALARADVEYATKRDVEAVEALKENPYRAETPPARRARRKAKE